MTVWAFAQITHKGVKDAVYDSVKKGTARFGWSSSDSDNPLLNWFPRQAFLRLVKNDDWVVYVNMPIYGRCVVARVTGPCFYDKGLIGDWGTDFRSAIPIDTATIIEFNRNDPNVLPTVNLNPRSRYQRVLAVDDFLKSIENLKSNSVNLKEKENKFVYHLKENSNEILEKLTGLIHESHKSKNLERFLAQVFRKISNVVDVNENGFGWKTDNGADLIVTLNTSLSNIQFENKIVIQIKSFGGEHYDLNAIDQIVNAIKIYDAMGGIIITTAQSTAELESAIQKRSEEINKPIDLIAGADVARFVIKNAPELLFEL